MIFRLSIREDSTHQLQKFSFPDPIDPFRKASGRYLLTMALSLLVHLLEFTPSGFDLYPLHVNKTRHLKP
jgi:hypothetical protein